MTSLKHFLRFWGFSLLLLPACVLGQQRTLPVGLGTQFNFDQISVRIVNFMAMSIGFIVSAVFIVGALFIVLGGANESNIEKGKKMMIDSLIGLAVTLGAYAILRTVFYFLSPT